MAAAKRAELLILDEPVASLDPLARRSFLADLEEFVAELAVSAVLSSHLLGDLARVCDYLIVLAAAHVQLDGPVLDLLQTHSVIDGRVVHTEAPVPDAAPVDLEDLVLAYMAGEVQR